MQRLNWHQPEELKNIKDTGNIIFIDQDRWAFHEAAFHGMNDDGMPVYESEGKVINIKDIFLWCTRYDLLMSTNFVHFIPNYSYPIQYSKKKNYDDF